MPPNTKTMFMSHTLAGFLGAAALIVIAIAVAVVYLGPKNPSVSADGNHYTGPSYPTPGTSGTPSSPTSGQSSGQKFGSLAGPDIPFPYLRWGGFGPIWHAAQSPTATSSVICAIQPPIGTSTPTFISWRPDNLAFGSGQTFDISTTTAANGYGSSSPALVQGASLASSVVWIPNASTTANVNVLNGTNGNGSTIFTIVNTSTSSPTFLTFRVATATPGTFATGLAGNCQAEFNQI